MNGNRMTSGMAGMSAGNTGQGPTASDEVGATDNRLALNPNEFLDGEMADWEDGKDYVLTGVRVRQVSPGEFTVTGIESGTLATASETAEEPAGAEEAGGAAETAGEAEAAPESAYPNPAVAKMMRA